MINEIRNQILAMAEPDYQVFSAKLLPGIPNVAGVRLPKLRALAKEIAKGDFRTYLTQMHQQFLSHPQQLLMEERMVQGMVIGCAKMELEERLSAIASFVPQINCWSVCDSFCSGLKFIPKHQERVWQFLQPYYSSSEEYALRFGVITAMDYYITPAYLPQLFQHFDAISHPGYYVKMGVAWALSMCYVRYPEETLSYFSRCQLDDFTYQKALQKIIESRQITQEQRQFIREMKKSPRTYPNI